jgi:hypothetical protein
MIALREPRRDRLGGEVPSVWLLSRRPRQRGRENCRLSDLFPPAIRHWNRNRRREFNQQIRDCVTVAPRCPGEASAGSAASARNCRPGS